MIYKNFQVYTPTKNSTNYEFIQYSAIFIKSECGNDWYELNKTFDPSKVKIMYNNKNVVLAADVDSSKLWPNTFNISVIEYDGNLNDLVGKVYNESTNKFTEYEPSTEELISLYSDKINKILYSVSIDIQPLQFAEQIGEITESEKEYMFELKKYALIISRLKMQEGFPHKIEWPEKPVQKNGTI